MTEQTFRSPNFFEREIDLSSPVVSSPTGTPGGVIGTANRGPAFVPVTVGNFNDFIEKFGNLDPKHYGPYAANEFLKHKSSLTYMRVLGAGGNSTDADILNTLATGRVAGAGFALTGTLDGVGRHTGVVQYLVAKHEAMTEEVRVGTYTNNDSITNAASSNLVRGMFMTPVGAKIMILANGETFSPLADDVAIPSNEGTFKIAIKSDLGAAFATTDNVPGLKVFEVSLVPSASNYYAKVMNTDPDKFVSEQHLLYADFPVEDKLAAPIAGGSGLVAIVSGSHRTSSTSGAPSLRLRDAFGSFNTRYRTPKTPWFISQPFGATEYDLFRFEAIDDGEYANKLYKIAVVDLKASLDPTDPFGTFTVQIRSWNDSDLDTRVLESYSNCSLNPTAPNYVAKVIGDRKVSFDFDATVDSERRLVTSGKYPNVSRLVRIVMSEAVENATIPDSTLPFGFRGAELPYTNDSLTDADPGAAARFGASGSVGPLAGAILPPVPFRTKVTRGPVGGSDWLGQPGQTETATPVYYWGVKFEVTSDLENLNSSSERNRLLDSYTKFFGLPELDVVLTGSALDSLNNNKFTLAKVALAATSLSELTGTVSQQMRSAAYIRDGVVDPSTYAINDGVLGNRWTMASLLTQLSASTFNKYSQYTKFVTFMQGGWDGVNILDRDARRLNDKASSFSEGGGAAETYKAPGFGINLAGKGQSNSTVMSYLKAVDIMTDPLAVGVNVLSIPGIRDEYVTEYTMNKVREYGLSYYVMDVPAYADNGDRIFDDSTKRPNVENTVKQFESRTLDNNYTGVYFPDVVIDDAFNRRKVKVPASIAVMGALAFNDRIAYPWFAPAGFNRAALDFVNNVGVRLNVSDRDSLYDARINPIATFPRLGYVIYGQKTLQVSKSALDRVNVRRLLLEVKRIIIGIAQRMVFEQNTSAVRNRFVTDATVQLGLIQAAAGVEAFQVVMNESNNTQEDVDNNRLNGRIVVVPTRVIEYIAVDFIITNSGIQFV